MKSRAFVGLGRYEDAEYWARKAVRQGAARLALQELYRKKPDYSLEQYARDDFVLTPAAHQLVVEGLRKAGLPEVSADPGAGD